MTTEDSHIGNRIHVIGNSSSGKSTLAARLAGALDAPLVELDAINWRPGWVGLNTTDPEELKRRIREATRGERWVVAGSYTRISQEIFWPRLDTVVWLDLPLPLLVWRFLRRTSGTVHNGGGAFRRSSLSRSHAIPSTCSKWRSADTRSAPVSMTWAAIQTAFVGMGRPFARSDAAILE